MFDVELTKTKEKVNAFTDFLNGRISGIRFKPKIREDKIDFLETTVTIENGYLITSLYSKPTDSKQYLIPSSVHKENVADNIPKTFGKRLRRLCSDRVEGDRIFAFIYLFEILKTLTTSHTFTRKGAKVIKVFEYN